jgi:hypothetical protein
MFTLAITSALSLPAFGQDVDKDQQIRELQAQVKVLQAENNSLRAQVRAQEVATVASNPAPSPTSRPAATKPAGFSYKSKPVTKEWAGRMYKRFGDKVVNIDGDYYLPANPGNSENPKTGVGPQPPGRGTIVKSNCVVTQVLKGGGEILARDDYSYAAPIYHLQIETKGLVEQQMIFPTMVYVGTYTYTNRLGASTTIQDYRVMKIGVTFDQFADALNGGLELVDYVKTKVTVPDGAGMTGARGDVSPPSGRTHEEERIVPKPVGTPQ